MSPLDTLDTIVRLLYFLTPTGPFQGYLGAVHRGTIAPVGAFSSPVLSARPCLQTYEEVFKSQNGRRRCRIGFGKLSGEGYTNKGIKASSARGYPPRVVRQMCAKPSCISTELNRIRLYYVDAQILCFLMYRAESRLFLGCPELRAIGLSRRRSRVQVSSLQPAYMTVL